MRRLKLVLGVGALMVAIMAASAAPAAADTVFSSGDKDDFCDFHDCDKDFCDFFDCDLVFNDRDRNFFDFGGGINQDVEQEAESGDIDQSFNVSQTGDNSNQTVGIQGVANTGNVQNVIDVVDTGNEAFNDGSFGDENCFFFAGEFICRDFDNRDFDVFDNDGTNFEFDDVGSSITVSPTNITSSDQQVNQAATASG